ncbi:hypothetical protein D9M73_277830 [compost metagenome]
MSLKVQASPLATCNWPSALRSSKHTWVSCQPSRCWPAALNMAWRSVATVKRRDRSSNWLVCAWVSRSACNWRRWRAARLPVSAAINRKNTRVSTSSSRWMVNEKLGGMNRKS